MHRKDTLAPRMGYFAKRDFSFYATHVILCVVFLLLPYIFTANGEFLRIPNMTSGHDRLYFAVYLLLLLFFYLNYYYLIPRLYFGNRRMVYFAVICVFLFFFLFIAFYFDTPHTNPLETSDPRRFGPPPPMPDDHGIFKGPPPFGRPNQNIHTLLLFLTGVLASLFLSSSRRLQASERDRMESELQLLRAQINPHFLFNTLNSIYALAIRKDDKTAASIVQLSELMRYIMNNNGDRISLRRELGYIDNYIELQRSRLGETVSIDYGTTGDPNNLSIAPLILISFIENAFKHGVNPNERSDIHIMIAISGNRLELSVGNRKVKLGHSESGIGLKNTQERLDRAYTGRYELEVDDDPETYKTKLTLEL